MPFKVAPASYGRLVAVNGEVSRAGLVEHGKDLVHRWLHRMLRQRQLAGYLVMPYVDFVGLETKSRRNAHGLTATVAKDASLFGGVHRPSPLITIMGCTKSIVKQSVHRYPCSSSAISGGLSEITSATQL
jgi:hypothetical protein